MDLLVADVVSQVTVIKACHGEGAVTVLPLEVSAVRKILVNPSGRVCLERAHELRNADSAWRFEIEMYVVSNPSSTDQPASLATHNLSRACKQAWSPLGIEPRPAILGSPHQVDPEREVGIRQFDESPKTDLITGSR